MYVYTYLYSQLYIYIHIHRYACPHIVYLCKFVCVYIHIHIDTNIYIYSCIHTSLHCMPMQETVYALYLSLSLSLSLSISLSLYIYIYIPCMSLCMLCMSLPTASVGSCGASIESVCPPPHLPYIPLLYGQPYIPPLLSVHIFNNLSIILQIHTHEYVYFQLLMCAHLHEVGVNQPPTPCVTSIHTHTHEHPPPA